MDKRQLVDGCKRGDSASVEALYRSYSGKLMGICRHYVDSQEVAEDLLHDAFIVILSSTKQSWKIEILKKNNLGRLNEREVSPQMRTYFPIPIYIKRLAGGQGQRKMCVKIN